LWVSPMREYRHCGLWAEPSDTTVNVPGPLPVQSVGATADAVVKPNKTAHDAVIRSFTIDFEFLNLDWVFIFIWGFAWGFTGTCFGCETNRAEPVPEVIGFSVGFILLIFLCERAFRS